MAHIDATAATFQKEVMESPVLTLVDFWAPWCGPCRMLGPVLEELANEHGATLKVVKVNVDDEMNLAMQYGINSIPAVKIFHNGKMVHEFVGLKQKDDLNNIIASLGNVA